MSSIEWPLVISFVAMITALYCLLTLLIIRLRKPQDDRTATFRHELDAMGQKIDLLQGQFVAAQASRSQIEPIIKQLRELEDRLDSLDLRGGGAEASYKMASRLAKRGIAVDELAKTCGMTKGEAELLKFMRQA